MKIEGEPLKRWCVNYGGELVGHWDTAHEAWDGYRNYEDKIRPVTDPGKKYRYTFRDGRKELDIIQFKAAIAAETRAATNTGDTSMSVGPVTSFAIESEPEADAYLRDLLANPEFRSMDEVRIRAQKYIHDEALRTYFITKGQEMLKG